MKSLKILVLFLFIASFSTTTEAQIWKKIKDKVKRKAEEKVDQKTDKVIDDVLSGNKKNKKSINLQGTYKFNQSILIEFSTNDGSKAELELLFSRDNKDIVCMTLDPEQSGGMGGEVYNIITSKSVTMFMNMPGMKIRKSMTNEQFSKFDNSKKIPSKNELKKTGNIKSILGFACHEYIYENDGGTITAWVTKEKFPIEGKFIPMLGMNNNESFEGFVMELNFKATNESGNVKVVKINKNRSVTINTKEYKSMGF
jgi:Na+-translocating ferredoxin:NAD+ oxidoreductase RnfG subunit